MKIFLELTLDQFEKVKDVLTFTMPEPACKGKTIIEHVSSGEGANIQLPECIVADPYANMPAQLPIEEVVKPKRTRMSKAKTPATCANHDAETEKQEAEDLALLLSMIE